MARGGKITGALLMAVVIVAFGYIIGNFALGILDQASHGAPSAEFDFDYADRRITVTHSTGDVVQAEKLVLEVENGENETFRWENASAGPVRSGDSVVLGEPGTNATFTVPFAFEPGDTVRVVYRDSSGRVVLAEYVVPER